MAKRLSMPHIGIILDAIYINCTKQNSKQRTVRQLAKDTNTSLRTIDKVRKILSTMNLLIIEGTRAQQVCTWHPGKAKPNPVMLAEVYRVYTKDSKCRVKVEIKKEPRVPSLESALRALVFHGCTGVIELKEKIGGIPSTRTFNLSMIEVGE